MDMQAGGVGAQRRVVLRHHVRYFLLCLPEADARRVIVMPGAHMPTSDLGAA